MKTHLIAVAHGTDSQDGRATIHAVRQHLQTLLDRMHGVGAVQVHEAYVDVQKPELDAVVASFSDQDRVIIVPLLLSIGFHTQVDMARAARNCPAHTLVARALGPNTELARLQRIRLAQKGWQSGAKVIMAGAGSSRPEGRAAVFEQARLLSHELGQDVGCGFIADIEPRIRDVVEASCSRETGESVPIFVSNYLMGKGFFDTRLHQLAPHAQVAQPLVLPQDQEAIELLATIAYGSYRGAIGQE